MYASESARHFRRVGGGWRAGVFVVSAFVVVSTVLAAAAVAAPASTITPCAPVTGAAFNYKAVGGAQLSGDRYTVEALGMSCSLARSWVSKLTFAVPAGG